MIGLMLLGAGALYFGLMFFVMRGAWRAGRSEGGSVLQGLAFAFAGFLLVYLPIFWNHIPVLLEHRARCAKDAGFKVYVTPKQWIEKNQDLVAKLRRVDLDKITPAKTTQTGFSRYEIFGGALARESLGEGKDVQMFGVRFGRSESRVVDAGTGEILTTRISYSTSQREDARFWLHHSCPSSQEELAYKHTDYVSELMELLK